MLGGIVYFFVQLIFTVGADQAPQSHVYGLTAIVPLVTPFIMRVQKKKIHKLEKYGIIVGAIAVSLMLFDPGTYRVD